MEITLKMKIQDQEFDLVANMTNNAGRIYRQQFGRDVLKDMSAIYRTVNKSIYDGLDLTGIEIAGKTEEEIYEQLMSRVDVSKLIAVETEKEPLSFEETERCAQIVWAFVKNADKNLPGFEEWIDSFDFILPVADITCALYDAWTKSAVPTVELKN